MSAAEQMGAALLAMVEAGARPPCGVHQVEHLWTSEDAAERARATALCQPCPLYLLCAAAADELKPSFGTWAGRDFSPRPMKAKTP